MPTWRHTIDIAAEHAAYRRFVAFEEDNLESEGERIGPAELGRRVAAKVRAVRCFADHPVLADVARRMEAVEDIEDYDAALALLYDWGDTRLGESFFGARLCWINTIARG
jgi:hypothetical protein